MVVYYLGKKKIPKRRHPETSQSHEASLKTGTKEKTKEKLLGREPAEWVPGEEWGWSKGIEGRRLSDVWEKQGPRELGEKKVERTKELKNGKFGGE